MGEVQRELFTAFTKMDMPKVMAIPRTILAVRTTTEGFSGSAPPAAALSAKCFVNIYKCFAAAAAAPAAASGCSSCGLELIACQISNAVRIQKIIIKAPSVIKNDRILRLLRCWSVRLRFYQLTSRGEVAGFTWTIWSST